MRAIESDSLTVTLTRWAGPLGKSVQVSCFMYCGVDQTPEYYTSLVPFVITLDLGTGPIHICVRPVPVPSAQCMSGGPRTRITGEKLLSLSWV